MMTCTCVVCIHMLKWAVCYQMFYYIIDKGKGRRMNLDNSGTLVPKWTRIDKATTAFSRICIFIFAVINDSELLINSFV